MFRRELSDVFGREGEKEEEEEEGEERETGTDNGRRSRGYWEVIDFHILSVSFVLISQPSVFSNVTVLCIVR